MLEKDKLCLESILDSLNKILHFANRFVDPFDFYNDQLHFDACLMNFIQIGEMVDKLSDEIKEKNPQIPWGKIKSFRNFVAHNYLGVDADEVLEIIQNELPSFKKSIEKVLKN